MAGQPEALTPQQVRALRVEDYAAEWRRRQASTQRADRPRATAAINGLYAEAGRPAPRVLWVSSPAAGALAYHLARSGHRPLLGTYTRGEIGSGWNRDWRALAQPFDLPPAWLRSLRRRVAEQLPDRVAARVLDGQLFEVGPRIRSALEAHLETTAPRPAVPEAFAGRAITPRVGRALLGAGWDRYEAIVGRDLVGELLKKAIGQAASRLLDLRDAGSDSAWAIPESRLAHALQAMQPGQFDAVWPVYGLFLDVLDPPAWAGRSGKRRRELLQRRLDMAASAGPWWALDDLAIVSDRPLVIVTDPRGRLHSETAPAVAWPDGTAIWAWHGVAVPDQVVTDPGSISIQAIRDERNLEVRRVMTERVGWERIAREGGARLVQTDSAGQLWEMKQLMDASWSEGPARFVEVENSTPEPDGSRRHYFIRVPPWMQSARQAVAWTFELGEVEYRPVVET